VSVRGTTYLVGEALLGGRCMGEPAGGDTPIPPQALPLRRCWGQCIIVMALVYLVFADLVVVLSDCLGWWLVIM